MIKEHLPQLLLTDKNLNNCHKFAFSSKKQQVAPVGHVLHIVCVHCYSTGREASRATAGYLLSLLQDAHTRLCVCTDHVVTTPAWQPGSCIES